MFITNLKVSAETDRAFLFSFLAETKNVSFGDVFVLDDNEKHTVSVGHQYYQ